VQALAQAKERNLMNRPHPKSLAAVLAAAAICGTAVFAPGARPASTAGFAYIADGELHMAAADGSGDRQLTRPAEFPAKSWTSFFSWSPDGSQLVIWRAGTVDVGAVYVLDADGSNLQRVASGSWPAWSPNGRRIAYVGSWSGQAYVFLVDANGQHPHRLVGASNPVFTHVPESSPLVWAPGRRIVYESGRDDRLYVVDPNRGTERPLTRSNRVSFWAAPSPDHVHVAYGSPHGKAAPPSPKAILPIFVASTNGGRPHRVTHGFVDLIPSWSPRGNALVFTRRLGQGQLSDTVFVVDADGTHLRRMTHTGGAYEPTWSPDGTTILFDTFNPKCGDNETINTVRLAGDAVTSLGCGVQPRWRPNP
jgi:Tol biopolymer transport system component